MSTSTASSIPTPLPPRRELAHPLTKALWSILRDRSVEDKMLVLNACARRLGVAERSERQEESFQAISLFVETEGYVPSAGEWDIWRRSDDERRGLPSASYIGRSFGSWPEVRAAFRLTARVDVLSARLVAIGPSFSLDELIAIVRAWAADSEGGFLGHEKLIEWMNSDRPEAVGLRRVPNTIAPFRRYGGFFEVLDAAGITASASPVPSRRANKATASEPGAPFLGPRWRRRLTTLSPEERSAFLNQLKHAVLSELHRWASSRDGVLQKWDFVNHLEELGDASPFGSAGRVEQRLIGSFGVWEEMLQVAGLADRSIGAHRQARVANPSAPSGGFAPDIPGGSPYTGAADWDVLGVWVRQAAEASSGSNMRVREYAQWRKSELERMAREGLPVTPIPSSAMLIDHTPDQSWFSVKACAGVPGAGDVGDERQQPGTYTKAEVADALRAAVASLIASGEISDWSALRQDQYKTWRRREMRRQSAAGLKPRVPVPHVIYDHLSGPGRRWTAALKVVFVDHEGEREDEVRADA